MGTCTIIATGADGTPNYVACFVPLREALDLADKMKSDARGYSSVRVYSESPDGRTLTLIYVPA